VLTGQVAASACYRISGTHARRRQPGTLGPPATIASGTAFQVPHFEAASQVRSGAFLGFDAKIDFSALSELDCAAAT
jgi:hypothetical protein